MPRQGLSLVRQWQSAPGAAANQTATSATPAFNAALATSPPLSFFAPFARNASSDDAVAAKLAFDDLFSAGARLHPAHNLPIGIRPECNSAHRLPGKSLHLRFGPALILRQGHPLTNDLSALLVFRLHARSLLDVRRSPQPRRRRCERGSRAGGHIPLVVLSLRWASPTAPPSLSQREMATAKK